MSASSAPRKKRSLIPAAIGVVVILAGGGAWVALNGRSQANPNPTDTSRVAPDTAKQGVIAPPSNGTRRGGNTAPLAAPPRVNVAQAKAALDYLFLEKLDSVTASMVRDSALRFYTAAGMSERDKGYAAFVVGQAYFRLKNRAAGCRYVRTANAIDPGDRTYATLLAEQCN